MNMRWFTLFTIARARMVAWLAALSPLLIISCQSGGQTTELMVFVHDPAGAPLANAEVIVDGAHQRTDASGRIALTRPVGGRGVVSAKANGFAPGAVAADIGEGNKADVTLLPLGDPLSFDAGREVNIASGRRVRVRMDPGSLVDSRGEPVTGAAQVTIVSLDPTGDQRGIAPVMRVRGDEDDESEFISLVMADITLWKDGAQVHLAPGKTATVEMVLPEALQGEYEEGEAIDGFWFDVEGGGWRRDGKGIILPSTLDPGKKAWVASLAHFTFWSPGTPGQVNNKPKNCVNVLTKDPAGNSLGGIRVQVVGTNYAHGGVPSYTNANAGPDLGRACLEFMPGKQIQLVPTHPASYRVLNAGDLFILGNQSNRTCVNGLQKHAICDFYVELKLGLCGNGVLQPGEQCDDGNDNNNDACTALCKSPACGDGFVQPGEQCDDGNQSNTDFCTNVCKNQICGDGFIGPSEACDDGNANNDDTCTTLCKVPFCGDGFTQVGKGEQCDDGNQSNADACTTLCKSAICGDGFIQPGNGEQCDNGPANANNGACKLDCKNQVCGDGFVGPGEQCDDGNQNNADACTTLCKQPLCGDGFVQPANGEQCDDGNANNNDTCTTLCKPPFCGDGFAQPGNGEQCDDGNANNSDTCTTLCKPPFCGDGFVQPGEQCDDANQSNGDACVVGCKTAVCGDGYVWTGTEQCDAGAANSNNGACKVNCTPAICGDGFIGPGEACDDGNNIPGDGCTNCQVPPATLIWSLSYNGAANGQERGYAIATDANGNVAATGIETVTGQGFNGWVRKYTPNGTVIWTASYNGATNSDDIGSGLAMAPNGDVIVTGAESFTGQGYNIWIRRYAATSGVVLWTATYNGAANGDDFGYNVAIDASGNVFVAGTETIGLQSNVWLRKYASGTGAVLWTRTSTSSVNYTTAYVNVAVDSAGNVVVTGYESDLSAAAIDRIIYRKYANDASGTPLTIQNFSSVNYVQSTAVDNAGNVLVTGFQSVASQDDIWVAKFTPAGALVWSATHAGSAGATDRGLDIASDANGNVLVTGIESVTGQGTNVWIRKYSTTGAVAWTNTYDAVGNTNDFGYGVAADPNGNVLVAGYEFVSGQSTNVLIRKYSP